MRLFGPDRKELMLVQSLSRDDSALIIKGKILGAMPLSARLEPQEVRAALKLLTPRLFFFILTLAFRRSTKKPVTKH